MSKQLVTVDPAPYVARVQRAPEQSVTQPSLPPSSALAHLQAHVHSAFTGSHRQRDEVTGHCFDARDVSHYVRIQAWAPGQPDLSPEDWRGRPMMLAKVLRLYADATGVAMVDLVPAGKSEPSARRADQYAVWGERLPQWDRERGCWVQYDETLDSYGVRGRIKKSLGVPKKGDPTPEGCMTLDAWTQLLKDLDAGEALLNLPRLEHNLALVAEYARAWLAANGKPAPAKVAKVRNAPRVFADFDTLAAADHPVAAPTPPSADKVKGAAALAASLAPKA